MAAYGYVYDDTKWKSSKIKYQKMFFKIIIFNFIFYVFGPSSKEICDLTTWN